MNNLVEGKQLAIALGRARRDGDAEGEGILINSILEEDMSWPVVCGTLWVAVALRMPGYEEFGELMVAAQHDETEKEKVPQVWYMLKRACELNPEKMLRECVVILGQSLTKAGEEGEKILRSSVSAY